MCVHMHIYRYICTSIYLTLKQGLSLAWNSLTSKLYQSSSLRLFSTGIQVHTIFLQGVWGLNSGSQCLHSFLVLRTEEAPSVWLSLVNVLHIKDPLPSDPGGNGKAFFSGPCKNDDSVHRNVHYSLSHKILRPDDCPRQRLHLLRFIKLFSSFICMQKSRLSVQHSIINTLSFPERPVHPNKTFLPTHLLSAEGPEMCWMWYPTPAFTMVLI